MKFFFSILCCLATINLFAQIQLRVNFEQDTIMLGDTVGLNYELLLFPETEVVAVDLAILDSMYTIEQMVKVIADSTLNWESIFEPEVQFEILNYGRWENPAEGEKLISGKGLKWLETAGQEEGQRVLSNRLTVTFWAEGSYVVPEINVEYRVGKQSIVRSLAEIAAQMVVQAPTVVDVSAVDTLTQLTPIKPILKIERSWKDFMWLYVLLAVLIVGALLYRYLTKKEAVVETEEPEIILPAHVIALQKLKALENAELWQKGDVKEYQTRLTYTLREYLENRYDMQALESTTAQISEELRKSAVAEKWRNKLRDLLQVADLVKFAKAEPEEAFHARVLSEAVAFVEETKQVEEIIIEEESDIKLEDIQIKKS